ncbi:CGNR zinc finger domain-containing protein [Rhodococcus opacus]|uniref:CGNR zinc finger domain-containing protein n=1 Tax=Rhodococcus opacus TaxID=37919 RepID=A0AAX3YEX2_RHOOP|nr:CGNR zinc finger domain-containing protein [Rhodococcus opacus]MBA8961767.1 putative RNA-binding Zn ribbon-like protein [Rhodococcus opacus]MBP2202369.1 putative RNA-binding Zn ribbon-like protein [Rhodococcus opacus]MCZ4586864.1 CGNR zinc finger domain-containing protein [Rhodococcus opacus]MDJ0415985.1 CGNR zinc finger domain-containing protein [Rhodococcus opacus]MDV6243398.1 CGNR zinc finger domain-containing protein [Rhodococcus opacus]
MQLTFTDYTFGASVATALVLTAPEVLVATGDALTDGESLHAFLTEHGIVPGDRPATVADLDEVRALRTRVRDIVAAPNEEAIVDGANQLLCVARTVPFLGRHDGTWTWHLETAPESTLADDLAVVIGTGLLGTVASLGPNRFRSCESPSCNGIFVDTSRAGRRRFCMPQVCGNRVNVANFRARRRREQQDRPGTGPTGAG